MNRTVQLDGTNYTYVGKEGPFDIVKGFETFPKNGWGCRVFQTQSGVDYLGCFKGSKEVWYRQTGWDAKVDVHFDTPEYVEYQRQQHEAEVYAENAWLRKAEQGYPGYDEDHYYGVW